MKRIHKSIRWRNCVAAVALSLGFGATAHAQQANLASCEGLWFSTSEDFRSNNRDIPGGPVISDGDLLTYVIGSGARLCARNEDLLRRFDIERFDHGLDALDQVVLSERQVIAAFSTELDSMHSAAHFTAGDLLFTSGLIIPNSALLAQFNLPRNFNLGLDAVSIEGSPQGKRDLLDKLSGVSTDEMRDNPDQLAEVLRGTNTDILFSTEGTPPDVQQPQFIDGDLLSARNGVIVRSNRDLLFDLPAGIPDRGVDYGLDAYTPFQKGAGDEFTELLSTEIQARERTFSDGDALEPGPNVFLTSKDLIADFQPRDIDMGLDALAARPGIIGRCEIFITRISEIERTRIDPASGLFDVGVVNGVGDPSGDKPFGGSIRVEGVVPNADCPEFTTHHFRVEVSTDGGVTFDPVLHPTSLDWRRDVAPCGSANDLYASDPQGWFLLTEYWKPLLDGCSNDPSLGVWSSAPLDSTTAEIRIAMEPILGGPQIHSASVKIRLDNKAPDQPVIALHDAGAAVPFGNQCEIAGDGADTIIDIHGQVFDSHFQSYSLTWTGGDVGLETTVPVNLKRTYRTRVDLQDQGTLPLASNILLDSFNLTAAHIAATGGTPPIECGYTITLRARDRAHIGSFGPATNTYNTSSGHLSVRVSQSFCFKPASS